MNKNIQNSTLLSTSGISLSLSATADFSLSMPVYILTESNTTIAEEGNVALVNVSASGVYATATLKLSVSGTVNGFSKSLTKTVVNTFLTPIGSSQITFDTIFIPAVDVGIGRVTINLTPRLGLSGRMKCNVAVSGPASCSAEILEWPSTEGNTLFVSFNENENVELSLNSANLNLSLSQLDISVGASVTPIVGNSYTLDIGTFTLPVSSSTSVSGSPTSVVIAHFSKPTYWSLPHLGLTPVTLNLIFVFITILAVINIVIVTIKKKKDKATLNRINSNVFGEGAYGNRH